MDHSSAEERAQAEAEALKELDAFGILKEDWKAAQRRLAKALEDTKEFVAALELQHESAAVMQAGAQICSKYDKQLCKLIQDQHEKAREEAAKDSPRTRLLQQKRMIAHWPDSRKWAELQRLDSLDTMD